MFSYSPKELEVTKGLSVPGPFPVITVKRDRSVRLLLFGTEAFGTLLPSPQRPTVTLEGRDSTINSVNQKP